MSECARVCVCVCVCERERERRFARGGPSEFGTFGRFHRPIPIQTTPPICSRSQIRERKRERQTEREGGRGGSGRQADRQAGIQTETSGVCSSLAETEEDGSASGVERF